MTRSLVGFSQALPECYEIRYREKTTNFGALESGSQRFHNILGFFITFPNIQSHVITFAEKQAASGFQRIRARLQRHYSRREPPGTVRATEITGNYDLPSAASEKPRLIVKGKSRQTVISGRVFTMRMVLDGSLRLLKRWRRVRMRWKPEVSYFPANVMKCYEIFGNVLKNPRML